MLDDGTSHTLVRLQHLHDLALSRIRSHEHQYWMLLSRVLSVQPRLLLTKNTGRLRVDQHILPLVIQALGNSQDIHDTLLFLDPRTQNMQPSHIFALIKSDHKHSVMFSTKYFDHCVNKRFLSKHIASFLELGITDSNLLRSFLFRSEFKEDYLNILKCLDSSIEENAYLPPQRIIFTSTFGCDKFILQFVELLIEMVGNERELTFALFKWAFERVTKSSSKSSLLFWLDSKGANQQRDDELYIKQAAFYKNLVEWCISSKDYALLASTVRVSYYNCVDRMTDIIQTKDAHTIDCIVSMAIKARQLDRLLMSVCNMAPEEDAMLQVACSLKNCVTECTPLHRIQGLKHSSNVETIQPKLIAALAHFHDTKTFIADFDVISQIEKRLFNEGFLDVYSELLESGVPAQYHWLDAEMQVRDLREARLCIILSQLKGDSHEQRQAIDILISSDDFDWIKRHIQIIISHANSVQKRAIARLFVMNSCHEELLSKHCIRAALELKRFLII